MNQLSFIQLSPTLEVIPVAELIEYLQKEENLEIKKSIFVTSSKNESVSEIQKLGFSSIHIGSRFNTQPSLVLFELVTQICGGDGYRLVHITDELETEKIWQSTPSRTKTSVLLNRLLYNLGKNSGFIKELANLLGNQLSMDLAGTSDHVLLRKELRSFIEFVNVYSLLISDVDNSSSFSVEKDFEKKISKTRELINGGKVVCSTDNFYIKCVSLDHTLSLVGEGGFEIWRAACWWFAVFACKAESYLIVRDTGATLCMLVRAIEMWSIIILDAEDAIDFDFQGRLFLKRGSVRPKGTWALANEAFLTLGWGKSKKERKIIEKVIELRNDGFHTHGFKSYNISKLTDLSSSLFLSLKSSAPLTSTQFRALEKMMHSISKEAVQCAKEKLKGRIMRRLSAVV